MYPSRLSLLATLFITTGLACSDAGTPSTSSGAQANGSSSSGSNGATPTTWTTGRVDFDALPEGALVEGQSDDLTFRLRDANTAPFVYDLSGASRAAKSSAPNVLCTTASCASRGDSGFTVTFRRRARNVKFDIVGWDTTELGTLRVTTSSGESVTTPIVADHTESGDGPPVRVSIAQSDVVKLEIDGSLDPAGFAIDTFTYEMASE